MNKVIGIAGGSGSGKSTCAQKIVNIIGESDCIHLLQDHYYFDQSEKFDHDGGRVNFDEPMAIDFNCLRQNLVDLKNNDSTSIPNYNFVTHKRKNQTELYRPKKVILLDGTLIYHEQQIRELIDFKIFIHCTEDLRFSRRLKRDTQERGREEEGVIDQFRKQVAPMHNKYVDPSKEYADLVIENDDLSNLEKELKNLLLT